MRIFLTGASGLVGSRLLQALLHEGHHVVALTRSKQRVRLPKSMRPLASLLDVVEGDVCSQGSWQSAVSGCDAVISLAGEPVVGRRWTLEIKQHIVESRILATKRLVEAMQQAEPAQRPKRFFSASAVGYYGSRRDQDLNETSSAGEDFLAQVCVEWENEAQKATTHGVSVTTMRLGIVLDRKGGALQRMIPIFRVFMGGPVGSGHQYISWIHQEDLIRALLFLLSKDAATTAGVFNITSPNPIPMESFCKVLAQVLKRPNWVRVPSAMVRLLFGEAAELLLKGQRVFPERLLFLGFSFKYPQLKEALQHLLERPSS